MKTTAHCTDDQLNMFLDGRLGSDERGPLQAHIDGCTFCMSRLHNLSGVDTAVRRLPLTQAGPAFTRMVMEKLAGRPPLMFRLLERLPSFVALMVVLGIMVGAFVATGVFENSQLDRARTVAGGMAESAGEAAGRTIGAFTTWLTQYLPFAFGKGSMGVAIFAVAAVVMLAAVDRVVTRRIAQK